MNDVSKIEDKIDKTAAGALAVNPDLGGLAFANMSEVMEFSKLMAVAGQAVPPHLRKNPGMCLAVAVQALNWQMDPFSVANKSYSVNDRIAYEAQLLHAVVERRAPIKGRIRHEFDGEGDQRRCRVWAMPEDEDEPLELWSTPIGKIHPKNSPLWKTKPDQQLFYNTVRDWCRRYYPDVILGVYAKDEIEDSGGRMRDVTPRGQQGPASDHFRSLMDKAKGVDPTSTPPEDPADEDRPLAEDAEIVDGETPEVDEKSDPYKEGMKAVQDFGPSASCPEGYETGSWEQINWTAGFNAQVAADSDEENANRKDDRNE